MLTDPSRAGLRRRLAAVTYDRMVLAELEHDQPQVDELLSRLELWDEGGAGRARWAASATVTLTTTPVGVPISVERYVDDGAGHLVPQPVAAPKVTPLRDLSLPPGSYRFTLDVAGTPIRFPVMLGRDEDFVAEVPLPDPRQIPAGFSYVPAGRFLFGYSGADVLRKSFFYAPPLHAMTTPAFLIARHEVTVGEWIAFLAEQPAAVRRTLGPNVGGVAVVAGSGPIELTQEGTGWKLSIQPTTRRFDLREGEALIYPGRRDHGTVDWKTLPISGISATDAEAYIAWLRQSRRLPEARLCTSAEWTRAARGADDRVYPSGHQLPPGDASIFETHRTDDLASSGPDPVGAHPRSRSPFDVDDLAGNVWEIVRGQQALETRGSGWYFDAVNAQLVNRQIVGEEVRDLIVGFRVCANPAR